jgi:hypothetical protein
MIPRKKGRIVQAMRERLLRPFAGGGLYPVAGALLVVLGTCLLVSALMSPSVVLWTGTPVRATEQGGIVQYTFRGANYTLNDTGSSYGPRTVYVDPSNPNRAMLDSVGSRAFDATTVAGPFVLAAGFFAAGFIRKGRNRRRFAAERQTGTAAFGQGFDSEVIAQVVARRKTAELARRPAIRRPD